MAATVLNGLDEVRAAAGRHLGYSDWIQVSQERVDRFAEATGERGPVGDVAPFLTLALSNLFLPQILEVRGVALGVNYGCNRVRFPAPVPVGTKLRAGAELTTVDDIAGGVQTTVTITVEIEGQERSACVVESVSRFLT